MINSLNKFNIIKFKPDVLISNDELQSNLI